MPQPATPSLGRKVLKIAGIILGGIVGFILLAAILLLTVLEPVVGRLLKEQVTENTDGLYTLAYDDLQLSLLTGTITLEQLHLYPDTALHRKKPATAATNLLVELETPHFQIIHINLPDALFHNRLHIGTLSAERPVITLIGDEKIQKDTTGGKVDGASLPEFLNELHIGKIDMQNATFRYLPLSDPSHLRHEISRVSLLLHDFRLPPPGQQDSSRLFHADAVQLMARDYTYQAPDSVFRLQVGLLSYSSKQGTLLVEGIALLADHQSSTARNPEEANHTLYNLKVPGLRITGLDLLEVYRTKQLGVTEVLLEKPDFNIIQNTNVSTATKAPDITEIYKEMSDYLTAIEIGELRLTDGKIKVSERLQELYTVQELNGAELALQEILLDSNTLYSPREDFFAEALLFSAENYTYQHPFSSHTIIAGKIELSTQGNYLQVGSFEVIGDKEKNDRLKQSGSAQPIVYDIEASGLHFSKMDLIKAWKTSRLTIGTIDILNPAIEIRRDKSVEKADTETQLRDTYTAVSDLITDVSVENINIQDASFRHFAGAGQLQRIQELEHVSFKATALVIDSAFIFSPSEEGFPVEEALLTASDYTFWTPDNLYTFTLDSIQYSTRSELLSARSVALTYNAAVHDRLKEENAASRNLYSISASRFIIRGLQLMKAIEKGQLIMEEVMLGQPDVAMLKDRTIPAPPQGQQATLDNLYSIVNPIKVDTLRLEDGTFTYREKRDDATRTQRLEHASATVLGLNLGSTRLDALDDVLPMQEMLLTARDYTYQSPDSIYTITLDSLHYSSRQQELTARHINVASDKEVNEYLKRNKREEANRNLFDVSAERFRVSGLDLIQAYETGRFAMTEIILTAPEVAILQDRNVPSRSTDTSDKEENKEDSEAIEQIADVVETFQVGHLQINDGTVAFNILQDTVLTSQTIAHVSVAIEKLQTVSLETKDPLKMFQADDIGVLVRDYSYLLPDSLYRLNIGEIRSSLREQTLFIDSLRLVPLYERDEFVSRLTYENDRFDVQVPHVELRGMNLDALYNNQDIVIEKALINNPVVNIYRDKRIPEDPDRRPPTLQEVLRQAEFYINVDTLAAVSGSLTYSEVAPNGVQPGVLRFVNTTLEALNITNDPALLSQDSIARIDASALLMGESELNVRFMFHLDHPENLYTYEGSLKPMDFSALNPLFKNLIFVSIEDGQINKATFSVISTEHMAVGQMRFFYNDFELLLIDKEDPGNPGFLRKAGSWMLNKLVIKSNNPAGSRELREGAIQVERDYSKSVFNHMGKAMIDGIMSSLMTPFVERITDNFITF